MIREEILPHSAALPKDFMARVMALLNRGSIHSAADATFSGTWLVWLISIFSLPLNNKFNRQVMRNKHLNTSRKIPWLKARFFQEELKKMYENQSEEFVIWSDLSFDFMCSLLYIRLFGNVTLTRASLHAICSWRYSPTYVIRTDLRLHLVTF